MIACYFSPLLVASAMFIGATSDEGQGTAKPGSRIEGLRGGTPVFGEAGDHAAALGKVVVVEIGGS